MRMISFHEDFPFHLKTWALTLNNGELLNVVELVILFLLAGDALMSEMHLRQTGFTYSACVVHLLNMTKEYKNLKKREIQDLFINMRKAEPVLNMMWLMEVLKI